ncbi:MAG: alpha/beta hydrolase [Rhizobiaceae bacterium]|nr:alpha/beta hydrolase [Rhizobiaceae bacterium]
MAWTSSKLNSGTGAELQLYSQTPKGKPKAIVQINHGMAEHAARYERFAEALAKAGYGTYAHDHRGHGATSAPDAALGVFARKKGLDAVLNDVAAVNAHISSEHPNVPIVCFGHSMGSIIGFNYVLRHPDTVAAAALWNSGVETGALAVVFSSILKIHRMFKGSDVPSGLATKATFETWNKEFAPNRTDFDWLSRDAAEVDKYVDDPLCGFPVSIGLWLDVLDGIYLAADDKNLAALPKDLPVHLLAGADDPCSERGKAVANIARRMQSAGMSKVNLTVLSETRHESLNEVNRDQTTAMFIDWLDDQFAS